MSYLDAGDSSANFVGGNGSLRESGEYTFTASTGVVDVQDGDCVYIISVFNQTRGEVLYVRSSDTYTGTNFKSAVTVDEDTTSMDDGDILHIVYLSSVTQMDLLHQLIEINSSILVEQKINNRILSESFKTPLYTEQDL
jgi:hypothetical protein